MARPMSASMIWRYFQGRIEAFQRQVVLLSVSRISPWRTFAVAWQGRGEIVDHRLGGWEHRKGGDGAEDDKSAEDARIHGGGNNLLIVTWT